MHAAKGKSELKQEEEEQGAGDVDEGHGSERILSTFSGHPLLFPS